MGGDRKFARNAILILGLTLSTSGIAQTSSVNFQVGFTGHMDCHQPQELKDVPIKGDGKGVLNADGSVTADFIQTSFFVLSNTIHFDSRHLGGKPVAAPAGTAEVRVTGQHSLRFIWNLPNNQLITEIAVEGQSCTVNFDERLRPGKSLYNFFDGTKIWYCDRPRVEHTSCQVH
jgi:hypothetical protein